jgi:hypothetical protein
MNKFISPFIPRQFPAFYNDDYPNFVAFIRAYYEWLEQNNLTDAYSGAVGKARSLSDYMDIDRTESAFLVHFKNQYLSQLPLDTISDQRLLTKHILELYRTKGTPRAYELLFRMLFDQSIDLIIPHDFIFRTSNAKWKVPQYIEVSDNPYLIDLIGKGIVNSSKTARAVVENYTIKYVKGKRINILYLSSIKGEFKYNEIIYSDVAVDSSGNPLITIENGPRITGSLSHIAVVNGGYGFNVGDILDISSGEINGKARVSSTRNENGKVSFNLVNGGFGFTTNAQVTVLPTFDLSISSLIGAFTAGDTVLDTSTSSNGIVSFANSTYVQVINFGSGSTFTVGDSISNSGGSTATITNSIGGGGTGASFKVGDIVNKEIYSINTDLIKNYQLATLDDISAGYQINVSSESGVFTVGNTVTSSANIAVLGVNYNTANVVTTAESLSNSTLGISGLNVVKSDVHLITVTGSSSSLGNANLIPGAILTSNITSSVVTLYNTPEIQTISATATVTAQNTSVITVNNQTNYFVPYATLTDTHTSHTATITGLVRLTDWHFPGSTAYKSNLDSILNASLTYTTLEVGTIAYLSSINPGQGYSSNPYVDIIEPNIAIQNFDDGAGGYYGHDAVVSTVVSNATGIVTAIDIIDSGVGAEPNENVVLTSATSNGVSVTGKAIIDMQGKGTGYSLNSEGFLSDIIKLQDSYYYQQYSYEIVTERMLSSYEKFVKDIVHPSGVALFGRYSLARNLNSISSVSQFSITQS